MNILRLQANIHNPFCADTFVDLGCLSGEFPIEHRNWEIQLMWYKPALLTFEFNVSTKEDHAGTRLEIGLFGLSLMMQVYDCRHYDDEEDDA